jgi:hypothetical protein
MANTLESDIIRILNETRDVIRANMEARKINASGRTSASIRVEPYEGGVRLVGGYNTTHEVDDYPAVLGTLETADTAPIPTLEIGRAGGRVPKGFYYIIREWSREKGLNFSSESERSTFAYFVARKIARTGTLRHVTPENIYSAPVAAAKEKILQIFAQNVTRTVRAALGGGSVNTLKNNF